MKLACQRLGFTFHDGQKTFKNYGAWVGDTPFADELIPAEDRERVKAMSLADQKNYFTLLMARCDHAIGVPGCNYEVGLQRRVEHGVESYALVWDYYDWELCQKMGGPEAGVFKQAYAVAAATLAAQAQGHVVQEEALENGSVRLHIHTH